MTDVDLVRDRAEVPTTMGSRSDSVSLAGSTSQAAKLNIKPPRNTPNTIGLAVFIVSLFLSFVNQGLFLRACTELT